MTSDKKTAALESSHIRWNLDLIRRYDLTGPRYTSYPTAPQFSDSFTETDLNQAIERSNNSGRPLSLYFHIPFCDTVCYYCACNKIITANKKHADPYLKRLYRELALPEPQEKLQMLQYAIERLCEAGYVYIGMDHFAKPDDALTIAQQKGELQRNFQGYATHGDCDLLAMGVSSISAIDNVFVQNHKKIDDYNSAIDSGELALARGFVLSDDDRLRQRVINQLICHFDLKFSTIEQEFSIGFSEYFATEMEELRTMASDGLILLDDQGIVVEDQGRLLIRSICMVFDAYLRKSRAQQASESQEADKQNARYSRII